jgi:uncharacterized membrane protein
MNISQPQFELLLQSLRDLAARVERLERLVPVERTESGPQAAKPAVLATPRPEPTRPEPAARELPPPPAAVMGPRPQKPSGDLESRIGSHWLNRIGIAAVLVGVSFFLKYAFENNWIGPAGRIVIGLFAGIAIVFWSEWFRQRGYEIFSYSLKALGVGVLYLSLWASFQLYHLLASGVVFASMVIVTTLTCVMALAEDSEIVAMFAIAGGFATPALLSTGENREIVLLCYLVLLDSAILGLTVSKAWRRIAFLGWIGTVIVYISWYAEFYDRSQLTPTLIFASLFFAIFAAAPFFILRPNDSGLSALALAFGNGVTYFVETYAMLHPVSSTEMAGSCLALAALYLSFCRVQPRTPNQIAINNLRSMHVALAMGLITVAIPILLEAHAITIGWLVEAAALLWVGVRVKSELLNWVALLALALGVARLLVWDHFDPAQPIFNSRMAAYSVAIAVLGFAAYQNRRRDDETANRIAGIAIVALNVLALRALSLEVADYYGRKMPSTARSIWRPDAFIRRRSLAIARDFTYSALWMAYGGLLMVIGFWRASAFVRWQALVLIALTTMKVFTYDTSQLDRIYRILSFIALGILLLAISFAYQRKWLKLLSGKSV